MAKVLLTGANGFVATHVLQALVDSGYEVTGTVRSESKITDVLEAGPQYKNKVKFVVIEDISASHAWDAIFQATPYDYVVHVAAAVPTQKGDLHKDFIKPAVEGNLSLLESARKNGKNVKHITFTGAISSMVDLGNGFEVPSGPDHWSTSTVEAAEQSGTPFDFYRISKKLAEQATWGWVEKNKPHFSVSVMVASLIVGPSMQMVTSIDRMDLASTLIYPMLNGTAATVPETPFQAYIDVRDLAKVHVQALTDPAAENQRFFVANGFFSYKRIADLLRERKPELKDRLAKEGAGDPLAAQLDDSKIRKLLKFEPRPFEVTIIDTVNRILEIEKALGINYKGRVSAHVE